MANHWTDLENIRWPVSSSTKGPRRVCRFCVLGILIPIVLLCIPLYMRHRAFHPFPFTISPSDMKLLNQEGRVSTFWCEKQKLELVRKPNGSSFNVYKLPERPKIKQLDKEETMDRTMMLKDDIKEYWGFYLLKGSTVKLSVCARHEGASFFVVRGVKDAKRCAFLGELDSQEESDELSDESIELAEEKNLKANKFLQSLQPDPKKSPIKTGSTPDASEDYNDENKGGEDYQDDDIYEVIKAGSFNQQDPDGKDKSNEETHSSWSSSEEALMACEGLILNVALEPRIACNANASSPALESIREVHHLRIDRTGFYYFIFANENEITENFVSAQFNLRKTAFEVENNVMNCTNVTDCSLPLTFLSHEHVVIEVPEYQPAFNHTETCLERSLLNMASGKPSVEGCDRILIAYSTCQPRKVVYMIFIFLVPIVILFCAR